MTQGQNTEIVLAFLRRSIAIVRRSTNDPAAGRKSFGNRRKAHHITGMIVLLVFLLGMGNFAVHKAVLESRHPVLERIHPVLRRRGGRVTLVAEFVLLLGTLLLAANGHPWWAAAYLVYSGLNGLSGWLILSRRI